MSINTIRTAQKVRPRKTPRKLQLKTNQTKTKYAINFEDDSTLLARSVPEVTEYTTLIAESDPIFEGLEYDWKFILNRWIERHKVATGFKNRSGFPFAHFENMNILEKKKTPSSKTGSKSSFYVTTLDGKRYSVRLKSYIKCHFCKLLFETKNKREVHERAWHIKK